MSKIINALSCKCPSCKEGKIFKSKGNILLLNIPEMNDRCVVCDYKFEREIGFFYGAMFVSYALAAGQMIIGLVVFWHYMDLPPLYVFFIIVLIIIMMSTINYRLARSIWIYLFYRD
ncbi:DUF983 domain-containing protein [Lacinutrix undariae]